MKYIAILMAVFLCASPLCSQPEINQFLTYDSGQDEALHDVYHTMDDGFIACGFISENVENYKYEQSSQVYVIKTDEAGNLEWTRMFGDANLHDRGLTVIESDDGEFLIGGCINQEFGAILISADGDEIWTHNYGSEDLDNLDQCQAVIELKSGEFVLAGSANGEGYIACINRDGDVLWENSINGGRNRSGFTAMRETEGGIVLTGECCSRGFNYDLWALKIDFEGEVIWDHAHYFWDSSCSKCYDMVAGADDGFAIVGTMNHPELHGGDLHNDMILYKIDDDGEMEFQLRYDQSGFDGMDYGYGIARIDEQGYVLVGSTGYFSSLSAVSVNSGGDEYWREAYYFGRNYQPPANLFAAISLPDNSVAACGTILLRMNDRDVNNDAVILRVEPQELRPIFLYWSPEDTVFSVLPGDSVQFICRAESQFDLEIHYFWEPNEDTVYTDTTVTYGFPDFGEYGVRCIVTAEEHSNEIGWRINAVDHYLDVFQPDSLELMVRRNEAVDFSVDVRRLDDVDVNYRWTHIDRNGLRNEVGDTDSLDFQFRLTGRQSIECSYWTDEQVDGIRWDVDVRSIVWYWWPHENDVTVYQDSVLAFSVFPFNPESDSLECSWSLDDEAYGDGIDTEIEFSETGFHQVIAYVFEGEQADTVHWNINVTNRPSAIDDPLLKLPRELTLYSLNPNPFNSELTARFYMPEEGYASIRIFDINGRNCTDLFTGVLPSGEKRMTFNTREFSTGVYLVRIDANEKSIARKAILLK